MPRKRGLWSRLESLQRKLLVPGSHTQILNTSLGTTPEDDEIEFVVHDPADAAQELAVPDEGDRKAEPSSAR